MSSARGDGVERASAIAVTSSFNSGKVILATSYLPPVSNGLITGFTGFLKASAFVTFCSPIEIAQNRGQIGVQGGLSFEYAMKYFKAGLKQSAMKLAIYSAMPGMKDAIGKTMVNRFNLSKEQQNSFAFNLGTSLIASIAASMLEMPTQYFRNQRIFNSRGYQYKPGGIMDIMRFGSKGAGAILARNAISTMLLTGSSGLTKPLTQSVIENPTPLQNLIISNVLVGTLVAYLVHPLDTAYKLQIANTDLATLKGPNIFSTVSHSIREKGIPSLFRGVSWNVAKNIMICGIISNLYHIDNLGKAMSARVNAQSALESPNPMKETVTAPPKTSRNPHLLSHNRSALFSANEKAKGSPKFEDDNKAMIDNELEDRKPYK